jgi:hypothetical protein
MKRLAVLLALFCAGLLAASFAFADDGGGKGRGNGKNDSQSTSTSTTSSGKKCRNVSLKGTAGATSFTITVDKSSKAGRDLQGKPATLTFSGKVSVNARMCSAVTTGATPAAATFELRNLKVAKSGEGDD